jgi:CPA2 family monovalent cation:H+ antiporter-2
VCIELNKVLILKPDSDTQFEWGDIIWIVGEREKIRRLNGAGAQKPLKAADQ